MKEGLTGLGVEFVEIGLFGMEKLAESLELTLTQQLDEGWQLAHLYYYRINSSQNVELRKSCI